MAERVVVTGMGIISPQGIGVESFWQNTIDGKIAIRVIDPQYSLDLLHLKVAEKGRLVRHAAMIDDDIDPKDLLPKEWRKLKDRRGNCTLLTVIAAQEAVRQAELLPIPLPKKAEDKPWHPDNRRAHRRGVTIGMGLGDGIYTALLQQKFIFGERFDLFDALIIEPEQAATTLAQIHNHQGEAKAEIAACKSGVTAVADGFRKIRSGEAEEMLVGGVDSFTRLPVGSIIYHNLSTLATFPMDASEEELNPYYASMPMEKRRRGFVLGEGAAVLVLESLEHARARGAEDKILAELIGYGVSNDAGNDTKPQVRGQLTALLDVSEMSGVPPEAFTHFNMHGTGTLEGDPVELTSVLAFRRNNKNGLYLSATKSMGGHGVGKTGASELIQTILAVKYGIVTPTPNNDYLLELSSDLMEEWDISSDYADYELFSKVARRVEIEYAMSNSFGFGGGNGSLGVAKYHP